MRLGPLPGRCPLTLACCLAMLLVTPGIAAQDFTPFATFAGLSDAQLPTLQMKVTYVGPQGKALPSLLFVHELATPDLDAFIPFRRPSISYANDNEGTRVLSVSSARLRAVLNELGNLPSVVDGDVGDPPFVSFALHSTELGGIGFESILTPLESAPLLDALRFALQLNARAMVQLEATACALDANPAGQALDVTDQVEVVFTGLRPKRDSDTFVGSVTVTNAGDASIEGPVCLVFALPATVSIVTFDGHTCNVAPAGRKFINLTFAGDDLNPGGSATANLEFVNPDRELIQAAIQVLAGPEPR